MARPTFEEITETATEMKPHWSNQALLQFHYFNPNGLYARKVANDKAIDDLIDAGLVKTGAYIAYGGMADFEAKNLMKAAMAKRFENTRTHVAIQMLREHVVAQEAYIARVKATPVAKTYTVVNPGSYGPAHPLHNPAVEVRVDGKIVHRAANGKEGHLWAIREGLTPANMELTDSPYYQALMAQVRHEA